MNKYFSERCSNNEELKWKNDGKNTLKLDK